MTHVCAQKQTGTYIHTAVEPGQRIICPKMKLPPHWRNSLPGAHPREALKDLCMRLRFKAFYFGGILQHPEVAPNLDAPSCLTVDSERTNGGGRTCSFRNFCE